MALARSASTPSCRRRDTVASEPVISVAITTRARRTPSHQGAPMKTNQVEKELFELERQYWQAMQDRNVEEAVKLTEFPCIVAGASGTMRVERPAFEQMMLDSTYRIHNV